MGYICKNEQSELLVNSLELMGNYDTLLGRAKRQGRASG